MSNPIEIVYNTQVQDGRDYVQLERVLNANALPDRDDVVDFTPLDKPSDQRLLFRVVGREFCHAEVGKRERVRISLIPAGGGRFQPTSELLLSHRFVVVPEA